MQPLVAEAERDGRRERLLEAENDVLRLIIDQAPLPAVLTQLVRMAEQHGSAGLLASILLLDEDGVHLRHGAAPTLAEGYNRAIDGIEIGPSVGSCGTAAFRGEPVVVTDIANDPLWADFKDLAALHGLRACWSTPIMSSRGQVLGTFALYYRRPTEPPAEDELIVQLLTRTAALAIERHRAESHLAETQERFLALGRSLPVGAFTTDTLGSFSYVNPRFQEMSGYNFEKTVEYWLQNAVVPERRAQVVALWQDRASKRMEFDSEFPITVEGQGRVLRMRAAPMRSAAGAHIGYVGTVELSR
ncbi:MAG TPA: GAF domain-containing protein [Bryobacteraceae bacterium]|nr:GAF domain-containing protein [Bryobacteraceae bacterium]